MRSELIFIKIGGTVKLIQGHPIGNTEEKNETNTKTNTTANYRLKKNKERNGRRPNKNRHGGKPMNKYQSSLLTWLVGISYATRKLQDKHVNTSKGLRR